MKKEMFIRWFFSWRLFRRMLFVLACLIVLIVLFYAEEDFRGWYAWHHFKQQEEAKGVHTFGARPVPAGFCLQF